ncbi:Uncharacterised protein [Chromobacterium violaceum]|uniref:Uncharacterized protein n=1 Tax=Chromobacterium violaceum TaxID=536 RepID=A0A3S4LFU4_CHRVL|nr:Uncharacterised protein [Chromobacterium violaceum]
MGLDQSQDQDGAPGTMILARRAAPLYDSCPIPAAKPDFWIEQ